VHEKIIAGSCLFIIVLLAVFYSGCQSKPVVIDSGDFERVRSEYQQLREEYERLQSDYRQFAEGQQFYVDYYRNATARIESGLNELASLGADSSGEIQKLRSLINILRNIVQGIIDQESRTGTGNSSFEG
jgi:prefoldin subunit 5